MQPRTLEQILGELGSSYDPQVNNLRQQQSLVPEQTRADIAQADAAKNTAYEDIIGGARRRGMGFSGIPLGEQAKYAANVYAPEVLRTQTAGRQRALSLEDAILGLNSQRRQQGQGIYDNERNFYEQQRQCNENLAFQRQQANRAAAAANSGNSWLSELMKQQQQGAQSQQGTEYSTAAKQDVLSVLANRDYNQLNRYINAVSKSAGFGNEMDKYKLQWLQALQPGLFKNGAYNQDRFNTLQGLATTKRIV